MQIEITKPIFKCESDEEIFFQRLNNVNGILAIDVEKSKLRIELNNADKALSEIRAICALWHSSITIIASTQQ